MNKQTERKAGVIIPLILLGVISLSILFTTNIVPVKAAGTVTNCSTYGPGAGTLQDALGSGGTVTFTCSGTIIVPEISITANTPTVIDATGYDVTLSGDNANRVFTVNDGSSLTLNHIRVISGTDSSGGGGAYVDTNATLTVQNSTFEGNSATAAADGGAIANYGTVNISNSTLTSNSADDGAAVWNSGGTVTITGSTLSGNTATRAAGAVFNIQSGTVTISDSTIISNTAVSEGGAIYSTGELTVEGSTIEDNESSANLGGGIVSFGTLSVSDSTITGNSASDVGGGIAIGSGTANLLNTTVTSNIAGGDGGGIYNEGGLTVQGGAINSNSTAAKGGGLFVSDGGTITITNSTLSENQATAGSGGIYFNGSGSLTIINSSLQNNNAPFEGALAFSPTPDPITGEFNPGTIVGSTFSGNSATQSPWGNGGAIGINGKEPTSSGSVVTLNIVNSTLSGNSATGDGGAISINTGAGRYGYRLELNITNATFNNNSARRHPDISIFHTFDTNEATIRLSNTILGGGCGTVYNQGLQFIESQGYNLESGNSCNLTESTDLINTQPMLEALAENGGPTSTHALLDSSPAIDSGMTNLTVDQRGEPRPSGAADDIGAFELQTCGDNWSVASEAELKDAITCFNGKPAGGTHTITLIADIDLTVSTTAIDNATAGVELVVDGSGFAVDGQGAAGVRPFQVYTNTVVTMVDLTVTGGNVIDPEQGGGIENYGNLTLNQTTVFGNSAGEGGGIVTHNAPNSSLTLNNSTISANTASLDGGGIKIFAPVILDSTTISNNAAGRGGAIDVFGTAAIVTIRNSILANSNSPEDCYRFAATITDGGYNLVETQTSCGFVDGTNNTIVGSDPALLPLADNGGPTWTHALLVGSPAIDSGMTDLTVDQRGIARPQGSADDIGAYEAEIYYTIFLPIILK